MKDMTDLDFCKDVKSYLENVSFKEKSALEEFLTEAIRRLDLAKTMKVPNAPAATNISPPIGGLSRYQNVKIDPYKISYIPWADIWKNAWSGYQPAKGSLQPLKKEDIRYATADGG